MSRTLLFLISALLTGHATADTLPEPESSAPAMPPVVLEFESCVRSIRDERSAAAAVKHMQDLLPQMKATLQGKVWQNQEEALILAQILNSAFTLLLTEPPCYGSQELAATIQELLSLFSGEQ